MFPESASKVLLAALLENTTKKRNLIEVNRTTAKNVRKMHLNCTYVQAVAKMQHTSLNLTLELCQILISYCVFSKEISVSDFKCASLIPSCCNVNQLSGNPRWCHWPNLHCWTTWLMMNWHQGTIMRFLFFLLLYFSSNVFERILLRCWCVYLHLTLCAAE